MSQCEIQQTNYLRTNSAKNNYVLESNKNFNETKTPIITDNDDDDDNNASMKTSPSLDDLLDIDNNENQNEEDTDETENDDNDSTQLSIDDANTTTTVRQKTLNKKKGKLQQLVK
jgi:hypothetical protein